MMFRSLIAVTLKALFCFTISFCSLAIYAQGITLGWDPNTGDNVADYVVFYGTSSGRYDNVLDAGTNTIAAVKNLQAGTRYYFEVTAFDSNGIPSNPSAEISYLMPGAVNLNIVNGAAGQVDVSFPVEPGNYYDLQASPDAHAWSLIWRTGISTSNDWTHYDDVGSSTVGSRFYRVVTHFPQ